MNGFAFSLARNTYLQENPGGYFLISRVPIRMLRLSKSLSSVLKQIESGEKVSDITFGNPSLKKGQLLRTLLSLTSKGYLKLDGAGTPETCPGVSIIVPVRDQPNDLIECLQSLADLDYPPDKLEIIVVDDGSSENISGIVSPFNVRLIKLEKSRGPAAARNTGAEHSSGDVLAFLDADCIADKNWLRELIPFLQIEGIGAVGGLVDSYYKTRYLDRYEEVSSSLNMGARLISEMGKESNFYVPSCNMLVSRKAFLATGGFTEGMQVGEDVDFCWRMRDRGYSLLYIPYGKVAHKHRSRLFKMLQRRHSYGTSEAVLYSSHRNKRKRLSLPVYAGLSFIALTAAVLLMNYYLLGFIPILLGLDLYHKSTTLKQYKMVLPFRALIYATLRSHFSLYYFVLFHLMRYYLILLFAIGFLFHSLWIFGGFALLLTSIVDYRAKKPRLNYPVFLFFYFMEHLAYQTGVFWGCLKLGHFRAYVPVFSHI